MAEGDLVICPEFKVCATKCIHKALHHAIASCNQVASFTTCNVNCQKIEGGKIAKWLEGRIDAATL